MKWLVDHGIDPMGIEARAAGGSVVQAERDYRAAWANYRANAHTFLAEDYSVATFGRPLDWAFVEQALKNLGAAQKAQKAQDPRAKAQAAQAARLHAAQVAAARRVPATTGRYTTSGGDTYITINVTGIGDRELGRQVVQALREYQRTRGPLNLKIAG